MFQLIFDAILNLSVLMTVACSLCLCIALLSYHHCWYCPRDYVQHCDVHHNAENTHTQKLSSVGFLFMTFTVWCPLKLF